MSQTLEKIIPCVDFGDVCRVATVQVHFSLTSPIAVIATHPWGPLGGSMADPHPRTVAALVGHYGVSDASWVPRDTSSQDSGRCVMCWGPQLLETFRRRKISAEGTCPVQSLRFGEAGCTTVRTALEVFIPLGEAKQTMDLT